MKLGFSAVFQKHCTTGLKNYVLLLKKLNARAPRTYFWKGDGGGVAILMEETMWSILHGHDNLWGFI